MFPTNLTTERLRLRPPRPEDAEALFERYTSDPAVTRYMSWPTAESVDETLAFLTAPPKPSDTHWAICLAAEDQPSGMISAFAQEHAIEIGYVLEKPVWGQGIATEAARAIVELAWENESIWRVHAHAHIANTASQRVLEKCGMHREGVARRAAMLPRFGNIPQDVVMYAQVRDDLPNQRR